MKGGKTAKCPEGQTRDKTTKECRDKKKPGRQTRRASVSSVKSLPKVPSPKVESPRHKSFQIGIADMEESNHTLFIKWYHGITKWMVKSFEMTNLKFEYNKKEGVLDVSYDTTREDHPDAETDTEVHEMMADPDDDCNYPLNLKPGSRGDKYKVCVSGAVIGH